MGLENEQQYITTLMLYSDFKNALKYAQLHHRPDILQQKSHIDSIMCRLEKLKKELNEYQDKVIRSKI